MEERKEEPQVELPADVVEKVDGLVEMLMKKDEVFPLNPEFQKGIDDMNMVEKLDYALHYLANVEFKFNVLAEHIYRMKTDMEIYSVVSRTLLDKNPELQELVEARYSWSTVLQYLHFKRVGSSSDTFFTVEIEETLPNAEPSSVALTVPCEAQEAMNWKAYQKAPFKCTKCTPGEEQKGFCHHALYCGYVGGLKAPIPKCPLPLEQELVDLFVERNRGLYMN